MSPSFFGDASLGGRGPLIKEVDFRILSRLPLRLVDVDASDPIDVSAVPEILPSVFDGVNQSLDDSDPSRKTLHDAEKSIGNTT